MLYHLIYRKPCLGSLIIFNPKISVHFLHTVLYTFPILFNNQELEDFRYMKISHICTAVER